MDRLARQDPPLLSTCKGYRSIVGLYHIARLGHVVTVESPTTGQESERYYYASQDPHTAMPDWVPFAAQLGPEARNLIMATLVLQKRGGAPTRRQLATALSVDERSIYRWLAEIQAAGAMSTRRAGRRRMVIFHNPKPDHMISDHMISDRTISDRPIRYHESSDSSHVAPTSRKPPIPDRTISDPLVVGVGDHDSRVKDPTISNTAPLKTPLARWLKRFGMNAARDFDDPTLDYATYKAWVEDKRAMGWEWRQIVSTLREAPLEAAPQVGAEQSAADLERQVGASDLAALDSTSRALARKYDAMEAEAKARSKGDPAAWKAIR